MGDYDGWITIGTTLDTKQLDRDLKVEQRKLEQAEKEFERLTQKKAKINLDLKDYYAELQEAKKNFDEFKSGDLELDNRQYKESVDAINNKYREQLKALKDINLALNQNIIKQGMLKDNISGINLRLGNAGVTSYLKDIGKHLTATIKKVGKWALAVFGLRTAYTTITKAMSTLSSLDDQLKTDLQYINVAIATALEPVVRKIVDLALRLLQYVGAIIQKITGKNPFENVAKNMEKANGSAKQMSKTLASFDEMNVVSNNTSNNVNPSINLTDAPELPKWMDDIIKNKDIILGFFGELLIIWGGIKLLDFTGHLNDLSKVLNTLIPSLEKMSGLKLFGVLSGVALTIVGIVETIKSIIEYIKNPSWENFSNILKGLAIALSGVALAMIAVNIANPVGWIVLAIAGITMLMALIVKHWNTIKGWFSNIGKFIDDNIIKPIKNKFNSLPNWFKTLIKGIANTMIFIINGMIEGINFMLLPFRATILGIGKILGKNWSLQTISIPKIPYVRKGAVINQPNRGVPVGSAMAGESGREGVIPLTDSQQMALLGEEIGRNVIVNLTNITQMNGRQINRELKRINMQDAFAGNR